MSCKKSNNIEIILLENNLVSISKCCFLKNKILLDKKTILNANLLDLVNSQSIEKLDERLCLETCTKLEKIDTISLCGIRNCNLNCYHCYWENHKDSLEIKQFYFNFLTYLSKGHYESLVLDGSGEIFTYWDDLLIFLKSITSNNFKEICFITNANLLNSNRINELYNISKNTNVKYFFNVSIDGITKEIYEDIRLGGNFEKLIENINLIIQYFPIKFTFTLKKQNYKEAFQLKDFLEKTFKFKHYYEISFGADTYDESLFKYLKFLKDYKSS